MYRINVKRAVAETIDELGRKGNSFTKRAVAEMLWPRARTSRHNFKRFNTYVGNLVLKEQAADRVVAVDEDCFTGAKVYVVKGVTNENTLAQYTNQELLAELARRLQ
jgi:hypothetical protein